MKYRKKPVVVDAIRLLGYTEALPPAAWNGNKGGEVWQWMAEGGANFTMDQKDPGPAFMLIHTLEGVMRADIGDWIIKGINGEFYPCKPDIFEKTYDLVEDSL